VQLHTSLSKYLGVIFSFFAQQGQHIALMGWNLA